MSRSQVQHAIRLRRALPYALASALIVSATALHGQQVDHYSPQSLIEKSGELKAKAAGNHGAASETLEKYGVDYTMLSYRTENGGGEIHSNFADIFVVVEGEATLLTGGELEHQETSAAGEMRGTAVLHGTSTHLGKGDVVHIPPGTPHQLLISKGSSFTYFVIKVKEHE